MSLRLFFSWFISTIALAGMLVSSSVVAQNAPSTLPTATPDLSGYWVRPREVGARNWMYFTKEEPPMLPWAAERYAANRKDRKPIDDPHPEQGRDDMDPMAPPYCMPVGFPRIYAFPDAGFELQQTPGRVYMLFESGDVQRIYTDGRTFPKGPPITFMGQSIGRWQGDTLIVETRDMNDLTWLDGWGHPHSDALKVEQRIRRIDRDTLEINFVFDDPKTYTKPWTGKKVYRLRPATDYVFHYFLCEDPARETFEQKVLGKKEGQ